MRVLGIINVTQDVIDCEYMNAAPDIFTNSQTPYKPLWGGGAWRESDSLPYGTTSGYTSIIH